MTILHYYPSNNRSVAFESYLIELKNKGYNVMVLTTASRGKFHEYLEAEGIPCFSTPLNSKLRLLYYFKQIRILIQFSKIQKVDYIFSHLQHANIIAVLSQKWLKAKVIIFRHHLNNAEIEKSNYVEKLFDKIINNQAKAIVVASETVKRRILATEKVVEKKLKVIPYVYDFSKYINPKQDVVSELRTKYKCELLLLNCSRFIENKRHYLLLQLMHKWVYQDHLDVQLILLDEGPLFYEIKQKTSDLLLQNHIHFIGFTEHFTEYMATIDLLIHPSLSETSSSTVKEVGLLSKPVIVCKNVGDFEDYIVNNENSFIVSDKNTFYEMDMLINHIYSKKDKLADVGKKLHDTVLKKFDLNSGSIELYEKLIKE